MNWKRAVYFGVPVILIVAISVLGTKSCSDNKVGKEIENARKEIVNARTVIKVLDGKNRELRDTIDMYRDSVSMLQDSVDMWRDSTDFYKKGLSDCQKSKKKPNPTKPVTVRPVPVSPKPVSPKPVQRPSDGNVTKINMEDASRNNKNIIVQNEGSNGNDTNITLGNGAVNDGNIVVNNGGTVTINDNSRTIDSLKQLQNKRIIIIRRVTTRTY